MAVILPAQQRDIYTVSRLNQVVRTLLEGNFPLIWLEGEVSNLARPASGHLYFSLKDASAQVRCALFHNRARLLQNGPENGQKVLVRARISLYEPRGDFQLIVEHLEDAGDGALRRAYEELWRQLDREGLFDPRHKKPLPRFPRRIGVITSPSGAAIRDVLSVLKRRFPGLPVLIYPVPVQGEGAGNHIARAIALASHRRECDVLLLVRGGGSLEDLQAFNEEGVARAIHACQIPLVCGVGHEIDVTIADFAADLRAPTPSAAAELVSPDRLEWLRKYHLLKDHLEVAIGRRLAAHRQGLGWLRQRLAGQHPGRRLQSHIQRLDELQQRLEVALRRQLDQDARQLAALGRALHAVSPLQTLGRGYAIIRRFPEGELVRRADQVQVGAHIETILGKGRLICQVEKTLMEPKDTP